jgi:hypothetical protein
MPLHPRTTKDLVLAPVAAEIDMNLQRVRDQSHEEIDYELQLELDRPPADDSAAERSARVLALALRNVELRDWRAEITDDAARLRLSGGSASLEIGLGRSLMTYITATAETP